MKAVAAIVSAGATTGAVSAFSTNSSHLILDVNGYFRLASNPETMHFYPLTPCRLMDTRDDYGIARGGALETGRNANILHPRRVWSTRIRSRILLSTLQLFPTVLFVFDNLAGESDPSRRLDT